MAAAAEVTQYTIRPVPTYNLPLNQAIDQASVLAPSPKPFVHSLQARQADHHSRRVFNCVGKWKPTPQSSVIQNIEIAQAEFAEHPDVLFLVVSFEVEAAGVCERIPEHSEFV